MKQTNTSGSVLHVPVLGRDVYPDEQVEHEVLLPSFTSYEPDPEPEAGVDEPAGTGLDAPAAPDGDDEPKSTRRRPTKTDDPAAPDQT